MLLTIWKSKLLKRMRAGTKMKLDFNGKLFVIIVLITRINMKS